MDKTDAALFFDSLGAYALFEALEDALRAEFPAMRMEQQKTQISFYNRRMFACVSQTRVGRKGARPPVYIVLSFGLGRPLDSGRIAARSEPYPGRWTHHVILGAAEDADEELMAWLREAYAFAAEKR